ANFQMKSIKK
ncbi:hypothetical protein D039_0742B, partial [Vibrio parahaemolyticus EKP-028]